MKQRWISQRVGWIAFFTAICLVTGGSVAYASTSRSEHLTTKGNLFTLVGTLRGTTNQMLANTATLVSKVQTVEGQLGQLNEQNQVLQDQVQTNEQLAEQLTTQTNLTQHGIALMQEILGHEKEAQGIAATVASQSDQLAVTLGENTQSLQQLVGDLQISNGQSVQLYGKLGELLSQLAEAKQEFRLFGQLNQLLPSITHSIGGIGSVSKTVGTLTHGLTGSLIPSGNGTATHGITGTITHGVQSLTRGLTDQTSGENSSGSSKTSTASGGGLLSGVTTGVQSLLGG
ncbi:MAG: hypothetical protein OWR52_01595 [Acidibacillus sp.]|uniref:Uncharacterized protein n=1 Tax=Sulfoacidibacillus ferrooxidans TaxID=2005001 RepID=A0A9X1VCX7_9BACL|nr:hypothetical protein [Sulfoacidibacillus ferrooxidans]MCI0183772.1 hypothetical protein [Sulfoacidibacillus ferrooxidans]MCY0892191.1 hypothetical protein [Acidibacillus sp.]